MPIDPGVIGQLRMPEPINPLAIRQQVEQLRMQQESQAALAEQRRASAQQREAQTAKLQRDAQREAEGDAAFDELVSSWQPGKPIPTGPVGKLYRGYGPERGSAIVKGLLDFANADLTSADALRKSMITRLAGIKALPEAKREQAYTTVVQDYVNRGLVKPDEVAPYSPETLAYYEQQLLSPDKRYDVQNPKPVEVSPGASLVNPTTGQTITTAPKPEEHSASYKEWLDHKREGGTLSFDQYMNQDANRRRPVTTISMAGGNETVENIADAIMRGEQPPDLTGLHRGGMSAAIRGYLAKKGYNLATATSDWRATQRYLSTLNGPAQVRLMQATEFVSHTVPLVQELSTELSAAIPRSRFPILNSTALAAAKGGALGEKAQSAATRLSAQIADLQSELAVMYRGGNSPTDESMRKAQEMLRGNWSEPQLKAALDLINRNVQIRLNSLRAVGAAANVGNPYQPDLSDRGVTGAPTAGGTVQMKSPNGQIKAVPADQVEHYKRLGAVIVGGGG